MTNEKIRNLSPDIIHLVGVCAAARYFAEFDRYVEILSEGRRYRLKHEAHHKGPRTANEAIRGPSSHVSATARAKFR
ncbi:hypothetical protein [Amycolatopsis sp. NPDC051071]|uniref:hypothetical protein n=1 Tax=Amycolatopsis sp. NPDC051071 TaxID=3154637 RepID=UPI0034353C1D